MAFTAKVWSQEAFPGELRATAQRLIHGLSRALCGLAGIATPAPMSAGGPAAVDHHGLRGRLRPAGHVDRPPNRPAGAAVAPTAVVKKEAAP